MKGIEYNVVQPWMVSKDGNRVIPGDPYLVDNVDEARRAANDIGGRIVGNVAFTRVYDEAFGETSDPEIIAICGFVPDNYEDLLPTAA